MFADVSHALSWAYRMREIGIVKTSGINRMRATMSSGWRNDLLVGLSQQEIRQQAASIIDVVYKLTDPACSEYLTARYGRRFDEQAMSRLIERVLMGLGTGINNRRAIRKMIMSYFGEKIGYREIRDEMNCRDAEALSIRKRAYDVLDQIGNRAIAEAEELLKFKALVH